MPKNKVSDHITDKEIAFAHNVLSGAMTDRQAAEAAGLNPDTAAYTKAKPRVRAYMHEHRAAMQQQLVQQEAEGLRRLNLDREQVLGRLWEIANLSPEMTRGSITGQVKALSMIVAMQNFIPDPLARSAQGKSAPATIHPQIYAAASHAGQQATIIDPQQGPAHDQQEQEDEPGVPEPELTPSSAVDPPRGLSQPTFANRFTSSKATPPSVPLFNSVPDLMVPFCIKNPFVHPR
jgi:hypothetical protein